MNDLTKFVAQKVMGMEFWEVDLDAYYANREFNPERDARDDYRVLSHVRAKWDHEQRREFRKKLWAILYARGGAFNGLVEPAHGHAAEYRVGDYARAAATVMGWKEEKEQQP